MVVGSVPMDCATRRRCMASNSDSGSAAVGLESDSVDGVDLLRCLEVCLSEVAVLLVRGFSGRCS